jgi:hypothetical protein
MALELAFLGHPLESLLRVSDAVLVLIAIKRKQLDDLVASISGRSIERPCHVTDRLPHGIFVRF